MTSLFLRWSILYLWLHIFSPNFVPIAVLLADFIAKIVLQVDDYEIVVNIFHISHNLTWYSAIVHKFTRIYPVS